MQNYDVRNFSDRKREQIAAEVKKRTDLRLPSLRMWNDELCRKHRMGWMETYFNEETQQDEERRILTRPKPGCRKCGIQLRKHQRVGIMWMYQKKRCLLADVPGSGKTAHAAGLIALLHETGEILDKSAGGVGRVIIVPRSPALMQWYDELLRMMPSLNVAVAIGDKKKRIQTYLNGWSVLLISPQTLMNDYEALLRFSLSALITDDVDALRNETTTSYVLKKVGRHADRMVIMTGTPLQKRLMELYRTLEGIGGREVLGSQEYFEKRHIDKTTVAERNRETGQIIGQKMVTSYKHLDEVKRKIEPMVLRRTAADLEGDVELPTILPSDILLDLYPAQAVKYDELRRGVIQIMKAEGMTTKHVTALSKLHYGAQICGGLSVLGERDGPNTSVKMDWIERALQEEFEGEKVVIFSNYKNGVRSLQDRLRGQGIGFETVWGEQKSKEARRKSQERFWEDDNCRVLIGTQAIEQSLNLQVSRHLINMDMIMNPARMEQLAGRIRRQGSAFKHVYVHNLLTVNTQEERYLPLLEREAALASHMWDDTSELFQQLSPIMMMQLITG